MMMKLITVRSPALLLIVLVVLLTTVACSEISETQPRQSAQPDTAQASYITAESMADLVDQSPVIAIGQVVEKGEVVDMARDPDNVNEPDSTFFGVGQIYHVEVERYLKGGDDDLLEVLQPEGLVNLERFDLTGDNIERARENYPHVPMKQSQRYLFFLKPTWGFPADAYMTGALHPWRFALSEDGMMEPESPWHGAAQSFPPKSSDEMIDDVKQLVDEG